MEKDDSSSTWTEEGCGYCQITRLPCKVYANFDVHLTDLAATSTKLATFAGKTRRECVLECISHTSCKCVNHNAVTGACELMAEDFVDAVQSLVTRTGWTFLATTNQSSSCGPVPNPCQYNGICQETCDSCGYKCICDEFYYGKHCTDDLQALLDKYCLTVKPGTAARYDGNIQDKDAHAWRCYDLTATAPYDLLPMTSSSTLYYTREKIGTIVDANQNASEYLVGALGKSCNESCQTVGKTCNPKIRTLNSAYLFKKGGVSCKYPRAANGTLSPYYLNQEEPAYATDGFCYGFARVPAAISCGAKHHSRRRLCRCT